MGRILDTLKAQGLDEHTLVLFTSDNDPAGGVLSTAGPLRGFKGSVFLGWRSGRGVISGTMTGRERMCGSLNPDQPGRMP
ncbi:MAG: sulfatase-like hydrolase/transferase [Verrucomicrobia bacterium]|nr:sulfatase-like hydrolase/transferase [Verrucomicrobiota bacterium]MDA1006394.1 sulfatase-like hydrolase/transferase [Verrucomicrobiota bacterium]